LAVARSRRAGVAGRVAEGGRSATFTAAAAGGSGWELPCERIAAARVINREPQPGQVTMLFGSASGAIVVLQRGQFMAGRRPSIT
jgi:hypothetical protein